MPAAPPGSPVARRCPRLAAEWPEPPTDFPGEATRGAAAPPYTGNAPPPVRILASLPRPAYHAPDAGRHVTSRTLSPRTYLMSRSTSFALLLALPLAVLVAATPRAETT